MSAAESLRRASSHELARLAEQLVTYTAADLTARDRWIDAGGPLPPLLREDPDPEQPDAPCIRPDAHGAAVKLTDTTAGHWVYVDWPVLRDAMREARNARSRLSLFPNL